MVTAGEAMGSREQLGRVVPLLRRASEEADGDTSAGILAGLKEEVSRLGEEGSAARLKELEGRFPTLDEGGRKNLDNFMRSGLHKVKATLLKEIEAFEGSGQPSGGGAVREWLLKSRERYEKWLSALPL